MSKIAILTDSSCDIPQELAEKYGIDIMGFHILLDDEDIVEREKYTPEEFYNKMRAAKGIPSTAAITPIQFCEKYCQYVDEGYTDVIHVPINRSGSSTYNNAVMAQGMLREERPEHHLNIHLLDPHTYSMVFGWYLCEMARKLQNGAELRHVISEFETQMNKMEVILGPYSLKQMKKSGRISAAAALLKVTTSISSTEIPSRRISCLMRSVKTAVFPDPAAADTKISLPLTVIASLCSSVQFISFPPLLLSCTEPSFSAGFEKSLRKNFPGMPPACAAFSLKDFSFDTKIPENSAETIQIF